MAWLAKWENPLFTGLRLHRTGNRNWTLRSSQMTANVLFPHRNRRKQTDGS